MLRLLSEGKIILNVDESTFNEGDLRYRKWRVKGSTNSVKKRTIAPSLSLLAAVSSLGDVYLAVS
jgi:hypothetical protein